MTELSRDLAPRTAIRPMWERMILRWATRIATGRLRIVFPDGREYHAGGALPGPSATISFRNGRPVRRLLFGGGLGFARAHIDGDWESPDIATLLELALANEAALGGLAGRGLLRGLIARFRHRLNANSRAGSRRNIAFHYDLGNAFYHAWLDPSMTYSSALFTRPDMTLAEAQAEKYKRIVKRLDLKATDRVLEIGCGWGGFAEQAIRLADCQVTGLTLSREQLDYARDRLQSAGLAERADLRFQDYRDCNGRFDAIVSIEMFEAVGEERWPLYFRRIKELLRPGGRAIIQTITIDESAFERYRQGADFIQTYIFPGGMLPSITRFGELAKEAGLAVTDRFAFGRDYERTLLAWDRAFAARWGDIARLGFDERFARMWRYYLHYCAAGFRFGRLNVVQFELTA